MPKLVLYTIPQSVWASGEFLVRVRAGRVLTPTISKRRGLLCATGNRRSHGSADQTSSYELGYEDTVEFMDINLAKGENFLPEFLAKASPVFFLWRSGFPFPLWVQKI